MNTKKLALPITAIIAVVILAYSVGSQTTPDKEIQQTIEDACVTTNKQLAVCNDDRVVKIQQQPTTLKTDFRCFQRLDGMIDVNEGQYYSIVIYDELEDASCNVDRSGLQYNTINRYDLLRAGGEDTYTEYHLLNGTTLAFGEPKIIS